MSVHVHFAVASAWLRANAMARDRNSDPAAAHTPWGCVWFVECVCVLCQFEAEQKEMFGGSFVDISYGILGMAY